MKIIKFTRINENIVRVTYKNFFGKIKERDAFKQNNTLWHWLDTSSLIYLYTESLDVFYNMEEVDFYNVNGV